MIRTLLACSALMSAPALSTESTLVWSQVESHDAGYEIEWTVTPNGTPVDIYVSADPLAARDEMTRLIEGDLDGQEVVSAGSIEGRPYFLLVTGDGDERRAKPTNWRAGKLDYFSWDYAMEDSALREAFRQGDLSSERIREAMIELYTQMDDQFSEAYREMFRQLAEGNTPLAFNCSAGKDRTGIAAALILHALDVPRATIVADYALSEQVVDYMADIMADIEQASSADGGAEGGAYAALAQLPPAVIAPLMHSDPVYIESALDSIADQYGSIDTYLEAELGVSQEVRRELKSQLTERNYGPSRRPDGYEWRE